MNALICCGVKSLPSISSDQSVPMWRLTERMVRSTLVTAWRLATSPTSTSPFLANATTLGVVRLPSALAMTVGSPPSRTADDRVGGAEVDADRSCHVRSTSLDAALVVPLWIRRWGAQAVRSGVPGPAPRLGTCARWTHGAICLRHSSSRTESRWLNIPARGSRWPIWFSLPFRCAQGLSLRYSQALHRCTSVGALTESAHNRRASGGMPCDDPRTESAADCSQRPEQQFLFLPRSPL